AFFIQETIFRLSKFCPVERDRKPHVCPYGRDAISGKQRGFVAELCSSFCPVKSKKCLRDSIKNYSGNLRLYGKKIEDPLKIKALITLKVLMIFVQAESYF